MTRFNRAVWRIMPPILRKYFIGRMCEMYNCKIVVLPDRGGGSWYAWYVATDSFEYKLFLIDPHRYPEDIEKTILEFSVVETFR